MTMSLPTSGVAAGSTAAPKISSSSERPCARGLRQEHVLRDGPLVRNMWDETRWGSVEHSGIAQGRAAGAKRPEISNLLSHVCALCFDVIK
jgi:hypothetical protein